MNNKEKLSELIAKAERSIWGKNIPGTSARRHLIANYLAKNGVTVQEWVSVKERLPEKDGQYLIFTTQYFTPDHIDEIDHKDGFEISGYCKGFGFLSDNGIHAKYWTTLPQPPKGY